MLLENYSSNTMSRISWDLTITFSRNISIQRTKIDFALCQESWDTSLEYPQRVLWRQKYFDPYRGFSYLRRPDRKPKWTKSLFKGHETHTYVWNFTWNFVNFEILDFSVRPMSNDVVRLHMMAQMDLW